VISSIAANIKWILSYIPFVGKYFGATKSSTKEIQRDTQAVKLLHENKISWNEGIVSKLRQFSSKIYGNLFQASLFKLFLTDQSVPAFDPSKFESYNVAPVDIREHGTNKAPISLKYHIYKHSSDPQKAAPVAVLTHGVKTTGRNLGKLAKKLLEMDHRVLIGDLVGFGANSNKRLNELNLIADVQHTILEAMNLGNGAPLTLISHSMGTALQTNALAKIFADEEKSGNFKLKVNDLVLVSPWDKVASLIHDFHEQNEEKIQKVKEAVSPGDSVTDFIDKNYDSAEEIARTVFGSNWDTLDSLFKILELNKLRPPEYRLKNINVIHGQNDPFVSYNRSKNLIRLIDALRENGDQILPKSRFCLIRDGNHFDMQKNDQDTYFPISNIAHLLKSPPQGIEFGEADFSKTNYVKTQSHQINNSGIPALAA
jgi:alpha-beta hydrolase superfamily lysophospholipase